MPYDVKHSTSNAYTIYSLSTNGYRVNNIAASIYTTAPLIFKADETNLKIISPANLNVE